MLNITSRRTEALQGSAVASSPHREFADLIEDIATRNDRPAFGELFNHFAPRIKAHLVHRGLDPVEAEARAMTVMVAVWRSAARYEPNRLSVSTWIFRIVRNASNDEPCPDRKDLPL
jgi:DNA-directed RNA polymerase specialized sigma24 family protein